MERTDKKGALERRRKTSQVRVLAVAFALGCVLGAGLAHVAAILTAPPTDAPDSTPPSVLAVEPPEQTYLIEGNASFRITFTEPLVASPTVTLAGAQNLPIPEASFDRVSWRGVVPIAEGADGACELRVEGVRDRAGNQLPPISFAYGIDTTPPTSRASVAANATALPFDIAWDASDAGSGIDRVEIWTHVEGGPWTILVTSPNDRGTYRFDPGERRAMFALRTLAVDHAGNREDARDAPDATVSYDPSPPSVLLVAASSYWFHEPVRLGGIAGPDIASAELRYYFAPDNSTWQGPFSAGNDTDLLAWTFPFPLGPGHYRLYARATGTGGAREPEQTPLAAEVAVGYDTALPSSRIAPVTPYWRTGPVTVSADASDDRSGVAAVDLYYAYRPNGTAAWSAWALASSRSYGPWTLPFDFPRGDGRYELIVRARDAAGNTQTLPPIGQGNASLGFNREIPSPPVLLLPSFVDVAGPRTNLTWTAQPEADVVRFEIHQGATSDFTPDGSTCAASTTCIEELDRSARGAWASLPAGNTTYWFRVRAVDDGGLAADSATVGAVFHGLGFDTPNTYASAAALPLRIAWSERLQYSGSCVDCTDVFRIPLGASDVLSLLLAVPATGDFRLVVYDANIQVVAKSERGGLGTWESLSVTIAASGTYYVVVDWSNVYGPGNRNEGWYTLTASV